MSRTSLVCLRGGTIADAAVHDLSLKSLFVRAKRLEMAYAARLRALARAVDHVVRGFDPRVQGAVGSMKSSLDAYASSIDPWARSVATTMVTEVAAHDDRSWRLMSRTLGQAVRRQIETAPVGQVFRERVEAQVGLIKSIPLDAGLRVQKIATEHLHTGARTQELVDQIFQTGGVALSRATMIARTETARTATEFTRARAEHAGSGHYYWRTAGDAHVRATHKKLEGTIQRWDTPPLCDPPSYRAHPGCIWNCRCYAEPIFEGDLGPSRFRAMETAT